MTEILTFKPAHENIHLMSPTVAAVAERFQNLLVGEIDPAYMNGLALSDHYGLDPSDGANCIIVRGKIGETRVMAAVVVPVGHKTDLGGVVCSTLGVKKVSMAPLEEVLAETGMEYGSITPVGLPESYRVLIDSRIMQKETIVVGGGKQISKIRIPTSLFKELPNIEIINSLALSQ